MCEDIQWSPGNKNQFLVTWKQDIFVFTIRQHPLDQNDDTVNTFSIGRNATIKISIIGVWRNSVVPQSVCWVPVLKDHSMVDSCSNFLLATTTSRGDVRLLSLSECGSSLDRFGLYNKEFIQHYSVTSLFLTWNPWKCNLLAQGIEKTQSVRDPCILIWDVTSCTETRDPELAAEEPFQVYASAHAPFTPTLKDPTTCDRTVCDFGSQETVSSFAWLSKSSFIAGMSGNCLKVLDLSDPAKPCQTALTRSVHGVTVDPFSNNRIASYVDSQVSIWKLDNLEKPMYTFRETGDVIQIRWSPLREAWLAVLVHGAFNVKLYNTYPMFMQDFEECEQAPLERMAYPSYRSPVALVSFAWHASIPDCLLSLDQDGCLDVMQVQERTAISWSPSHSILWSTSGHWVCLDTEGLKFRGGGLDSTKRLGSSELRLMSKDLALVMQRRAELNYGVNSDWATNISLTSDNKQLQSLWSWIKHAQDAPVEWFGRFRAHNSDSTRPTGHTESSVRSRAMLRWAGALAFLSGDFSPSGHDVTSDHIPNPDWHGSDACLPFARYTSPERTHVLRMCFWRLNDSDDIQRQMFEEVCSRGEHGRAAMMALFNLKFDWALGYLNRAATEMQYRPESIKDPHTAALASQEIGLVSLALSGYMDMSNELWRNTCRSLLGRLTNPYLRAMFTFLTREGKDFEPILHNCGLRVSDRLAFACLYLDDHELLAYAKSITDQLVDSGNPEAIVLTGITSPSFVTLMQNYIDLSGDVQTAAILGLLACHTCMLQSSSETSSSSPADETGGQSKRKSSNRPVLDNETRPTGRSSQTDKDVQVFIKLGAIRLVTWIHAYRDLLDRWRMWTVRAEFDIANKVFAVLDYLSGGNVLKLSSTAGKDGVLDDTLTSTTSKILHMDSTSVYRTGNKLRSVGAINQIFVACGFCGWRLGPQNKPSRIKLVNSTPESRANAQSATSQTGLQMHGGGGKQTICQRCLKPLPRCSICLMHLGTVALPVTESSLSSSSPSEKVVRRSVIAAAPYLPNSMAQVIQMSILGAGAQTSGNNAEVASKSPLPSHPREISKVMANLFVWCLACRHGGHASHLVDWFYGTDSIDSETQSYCPVSGCQCRCSSLDTLRPIFYPTQAVASRMQSSAVSDSADASNNISEASDPESDPIGLDDMILRGACASSPSRAVEPNAKAINPV